MKLTYFLASFPVPTNSVSLQTAREICIYLLINLHTYSLTTTYTYTVIYVYVYVADDTDTKGDNNFILVFNNNNNTNYNNNSDKSDYTSIRCFKFYDSPSTKICSLFHCICLY